MTESLCTSRPAHCRCNIFILHLHSRCRRHEVFVWEIYPTCSQLISALLGRRPAGRQIQVFRRLPVKLIHGLDCTKAMPTSAPAAPKYSRFIPPGGPSRSWQISTLHRRFACARLSQPCLPESCPDVSATFTTIDFDDSSLRWLEIDT